MSFTMLSCVIVHNMKHEINLSGVKQSLFTSTHLTIHEIANEPLVDEYMSTWFMHLCSRTNGYPHAR